ncbi:ergothioneine biosynthesis protein EgtB [Aquimarina sp. EL_43]|uniref:ergothioneine biosynthesis protein EgtB n=1 Tax=unclassified Aquimarina TaxID=2627091 RepID=UPI0018CB278F|nr:MULTISPECIES: ergothioneine biosynthesis protein EgtB [unclassified Aquimarina]MBG6131429.1 ergothioneine biosynthesis protein EgtB [Aquimarina sp. EL_35]MBG6151688.1 ergothioneine biosynthesis protein EgtB [Aquimarina sp. EL_32]MBG6169618.1 ergothioneine biosynthesis protein EgtB [Aquimarina sp. EL_43]
MIITDNLITSFLRTRSDTEEICAPLQIEDYVIQPIVDVSPPKWHLGHTTWFFEEFILSKYVSGFKRFHPEYAYVFNSYYESVGKRVIRTDRGNLSRPTVSEVYEYRDYITSHLQTFLEENDDPKIRELVEIGIHHEKQHQELLITDIKFILGNNPLFPKYNDTFSENPSFDDDQIPGYSTVEEGIYEIGYEGNKFCYDNELGRHKVFLREYTIANALVTNKEYLEFIEDKGYQNSLLWHAEAWDWIHKDNIKAPLYWHKIDGQYHQYTLQGLKTVDYAAPVTHISFYEAFAFAQWKGERLPTEFEWETAQSLFKWGIRWEWTESAYSPYPNYKKAPGALGEYNGKFMVNQKVLRGGSVATPRNHTRPTYRNFFHPNLRWQFTGLRLVKDK